MASQLWGQGVHCTPKFRTCTPCTTQVKDAAYVKILSKRLKLQDCTRFVQICTPTYENVPTRLAKGVIFMNKEVFLWTQYRSKDEHACLNTYLTNHKSKLYHQTSRACYLWLRLSPPLVVLWYVIYILGITSCYVCMWWPGIWQVTQQTNILKVTQKGKKHWVDTAAYTGTDSPGKNWTGSEV